MSSHALLSPSKRGRWALCPGSIREEAKYPDTGSSTAADDGTHTHHLLESCLKAGNESAMSMVGTVMKSHVGEYTVDEERAKRVDEALDYIRKTVTEFETHGTVYVKSEQKVDPVLLCNRSDLSGTIDVVITSPRIVEIIDYKDGIGVVEVEGNLQLEQYAIGVLSQIALKGGAFDSIAEFKLTIIQPKLSARNMPTITSWIVPKSHMQDRVDTLIKQAAATDAPDAPLIPGESQCKYCKARGSCVALKNEVMTTIGVIPDEIIDVSHQMASKDVNKMDGAEIRKILDAAPLIRQMIASVEDEALRRLKDGGVIEGLKLVNGKGSRSWSLDDDGIAGVLTKMGVPKSDIYTTKVLSPAKVDKLKWVKRDGTQMTLSPRQMGRLKMEYTIHTGGTLTVVPESDHRQAVITNVEGVFQNISVEPVKCDTLPVPEFLTLPSWLG